jgi:hypothetical protein
MQTGCPTLFKTIRYQLKRDEQYWLELSGNSAVVHILLSSERK